MNELAIIEERIAEVNRRAAELETKSGRLAAEQEMTQIFAVLTAYGYRMPTADTRLMMSAWVEAFAEYIAVYGYPMLKRAVIHFVKTDSRNYKDFPKPSDIIQAIKAVGGVDPRAAKTRLEAEKWERELIRHWNEEKAVETAKWAAEHADWIKEKEEQNEHR